MQRYLRNCWYMAGWADEVGPLGLARQILGMPVFVYRLADGSPAALLDRCPHRFAPLSMGERDGDAVVCAYHGLRFGPDGQCLHNPFAQRIPAGATVRAFAAIERDGIVWLWGGDPGAADPALIPDFGFVPDGPGRRSVRGYTLMKANYEYGTDNLMDLSHIEFVHKGSFAGDGVIFAGEHSVRQDGETLHSDWWMPNIPPPMVAQGLVAAGETVDHWLRMRWNAPASMRLDVGATPHGAPQSHGFDIPQAHILTPANADETHYFWSASRNHDLNSTETDQAMIDLFRQAFDAEDKPMIEAAYANVKDNLRSGGDFWAEKPLSLGIDQGGTRARRLLEKMIGGEAAHG
ncbi:MAG: Rieske 2Fe-2S domain-containing protein [Sphingomonadales bacterium]|nr:Rieske 2Fe-2S domain-containing protein [Sphingomonadales bacterium]